MRGRIYVVSGRNGSFGQIQVAAVSRLIKASYSIAANLRLVAVQRHKLAELTDQVRKAMRVDWCAHVDRQALEAQNAARIRLEDGTLASQLW